MPFGQVLAAKAWKSMQICLIQFISILQFWSSGLMTFSSFGSLNLSKRNQSHQTRRSELKRFEAARFDYFFKLWQSKPVQKESKSPNQKARIDMFWISQIWILLQALAAKTCPIVIKVTKPEDQNWNGFNLWQPKPVQKESKSPNQKIRIIALKGHESARFEYFFKLGSQNRSKRNQTHQTRRSDLTWLWIADRCFGTRKASTESFKKEWKLALVPQPDLIPSSSFDGQRVAAKRNQSHPFKPGKQNYRIARFEYVSKLWQPKPAQE